MLQTSAGARHSSALCVYTPSNTFAKVVSEVVFAQEVALGRTPPQSLVWEVWEKVAASLQMLYKAYTQREGSILVYKSAVCV